MRTMLDRLFTDSLPLRWLALRYFDRRLNFLSYPSKLNYSAIERPHYGHCLLHAARLAAKLGHSRISAIEFGVAGGNGLIALESHARFVKKETNVDVTIFGFDTGTGMPPPCDYRDMPYLWQSGYFPMVVAELKEKLQSAKLLLGGVKETIQNFCRDENPPPIGFIIFDLDYYSSTMEAFEIFESDHKYFLPRVACYFDDMVGDIDWAYNEFTGELLAIKEFNDRHEVIKLAPVRGLRFFGNRLPESWHEQIFVAHLFEHADYCRPISGLTELPLVD